MTVKNIGKLAKEASYEIANLSTKEKNDLLRAIKEELIENIDDVIKANEIDMEEGRKDGLTDALLDRLYLDEGRIMGMASAIDSIIELEDPVGDISDMKLMENGLRVGKMNSPIGVLGIIYESRPNVTLDASLLAIKSSNALILRGGKEAINSNKALAKIVRDALEKCGHDKNIIQLIEDTSRESSKELMELEDYLDLLIPRGSASLINAVREGAKVPLLETGIGNCHVYVDSSAKIPMALEIFENSKTQRTGVCNALETLLIHKDVSDEFIDGVNKIVDEHKIVVHADENIMDKFEGSTKATEEDYYTEYLNMEMAVKYVDSLDDAIKHITKYGSGHSDAIVTEDYDASLKFQNMVDSACVYVNASTRFTDGGELGQGAEMGISTQKLHARGPIGLRELTVPKIVVLGQGQVRS